MQLANKPSFRMDLISLDVFALPDSTVAKVSNILQTNKNVNLDNLEAVNKAASKLLRWVIAVVKWHNGHKIFKFEEPKTETLLAIEDDDGNERKGQYLKTKEQKMEID